MQEIWRYTRTAMIYRVMPLVVMCVAFVLPYTIILQGVTVDQYGGFADHTGDVLNYIMHTTMHSSSAFLFVYGFFLMAIGAVIHYILLYRRYISYQFLPILKFRKITHYIFIVLAIMPIFLIAPAILPRNFIKEHSEIILWMCNFIMYAIFFLVFSVIIFPLVFFGAYCMWHLCFFFWKPVKVMQS